MIRQNTIDQIFSAARIEDVVGDVVKLRKSGAGLVGLCPFHNEKTPSFSVSPSKGIYKCFGCGKAGNVVGFLMEHDGLTYVESLKNLANRYHIEVEEDDANREELDEKAKERESLYAALEFAHHYFHDNLSDGIGKKVGQSYFNERGIQQSTINEFGLGFALPEWRAFVEHALKSGFDRDILLHAGLIKEKRREVTDGVDPEDKKEEITYYDTFRDRVMFPIRNMMGKVVGFGGRILNNEERGPKYINSPETAVYIKSQILFGLSFTKRHIRDADKAYLVEGYLDVLMLYQSGIKNVVASSGTSLTEGQIRQVKRFTENVTVLFDGDAAGAKASLRGVDMLLENGLNVKVVVFPEGEDPDSYCRKLGGDGLEKFIEENEKDFMLFKADFLQVTEGSDPIKKAESIRSILESIGKIPDPLKRAFYVKECARILQTNEQLLHRELARIRRQGQHRNVQKIDRNLMEVGVEDDPISEKDKEVTDEKREFSLIRSLVLYANNAYDEDATVAEVVFEELSRDGYKFENELYQKLIEESEKEWEERGTLDDEWFTRHLEFGNMAAGILADKYVLSPAWREKFEIFVKDENENYMDEVRSNLMYLKLMQIDKSLGENQVALKNAKDDEEIDNYMMFHQKLLAVRHEIAKRIGSSAVK